LFPLQPEEKIAAASNMESAKNIVNLVGLFLNWYIMLGFLVKDTLAIPLSIGMQMNKV